MGYSNPRPNCHAGRCRVKIWLYAGNSDESSGTMVAMNHSDDPPSADDQQERLACWITGFVDGEGTFSVSLLRNPTTTTGYQVFPEFVVTQGAKSLCVLQLIQKHFGCGKIYENRRYDNHRESMFRYVVRARADLEANVIPFFQKNHLRTAKQNDFNLFCGVVKLISEKKHLDNNGLETIRQIASKMNRRAKILRH